MEGLTKLYGAVTALDNVSLDVARGEFVTLLGPSGSGKTTLLNIVSGAIFPTSGALWLDGRDITWVEARRRGIGMVFQNFALMPHLSIFENIAFPLRVRKVANAEVKERVMEALELIRLPGVAARKPKQLSGGQQQRVAIARALVYRPPVILMDEPLGALDRKLRHQMQFEIKRIHDDLGLSMIYVTHDQEEALTMSDRVCLMGAGRIQDIGAPQRIYSSPATEFSADFFGGTNIFRATVSRGPDGTTLHHEVFGPVLGPGAGPQSGEVGWMVRPEQLRFLPPGEGADNELAGVVRDITLSGQLTHYAVAVSDGLEFTVACLTNHATRGPFEGDQVRIGWSRQATAILKPTEQ
ncbi:MAG: ABC transporter ATP-binding protein [Candidimonas sp.]